MAVDGREIPDWKLDFRTVTDARISPDGEMIAFVSGESALVETPLPRSNLWTVSADGGETRRFTTGAASDVAPQWSPDGRRLTFLSDRKSPGRYQVHVIHRDFGESEQITDVEAEIYVNRGMAPISWSPDGSKIAFLARDPEAEEEERRKETRDDFLEFEKHPKFLRLYAVDIGSQEVTCLSPDRLQVWEYAWSPDGSQIAAVTSDLPTETDWYLNRLDVFPAGVGAARTLHDTERSVAHPRWSPDGQSLAFTSCRWSDKGQANGSVFVVSPAKGEAREITPDSTNSYGWIEWSQDSDLLTVAAQDAGDNCIFEIDPATGRRKEIWRTQMSLADSSFPQFHSAGDRIAIILEEFVRPRDVWAGERANGTIEVKQLTRMNPQADELDLGSAESVWWKGADGWDIQGYIVRPPGVNRDEMLPTIMYVHGGPVGLHANGFHAGSPRPLTAALATAGYAVFLPNPRGSAGRGNDFAETVIGDQGGKDWEDMEKGLDHLIEQGISDPDRLGITGSSYGGFTTCLAVTMTDRFKAGVAGACLSDWRSFHGVTGIRGYDVFFQGQTDPYDPDGMYRKNSGLSNIRNVHTPVLLLHGEVDDVCPVDQAHQYHRALKELGVDTELVLYPREGHSLKERRHILDFTQRTVDWMVRWV